MSVLVTVVAPSGSADLELDDARPVGELVVEVAAVLGQRLPVVLHTDGGAELPAAATLAAAGVLDGQKLHLVPGTAPHLDPDSDSDPRPGHDTVLACYLAVDTSDSMSGPALDAVNTELARLWAAVHADARLAATCRLAVVAFDTEARVAAPLTAAADLGRPPRLAATRPATNYEAVFRLLHQQVARDLAALRAAGRRPLRPLVVLVTDGRPTRGYWPPAHAALVDPASQDAADVVAFGFGDAAELTVRRVGTSGAFVPARTVAGRALAPAGMLAALMGHVLQALGLAARAAGASGAPVAGGRSGSGGGSGSGAGSGAGDTAPAGWRRLHDQGA